jgi:hypothetical protein
MTEVDKSGGQIRFSGEERVILLAARISPLLLAASYDVRANR